MLLVVFYFFFWQGWRRSHLIFILLIGFFFLPSFGLVKYVLHFILYPFKFILSYFLNFFSVCFMDHKLYLLHYLGLILNYLNIKKLAHFVTFISKYFII